MIQKLYIQEKVKEMEKERDRYNMSLVVSQGRARAKEGKETNLPIRWPPSRYKNQQSYPTQGALCGACRTKGLEHKHSFLSCPNHLEAEKLWKARKWGVSIFREEMQANPNSQFVL